MDEQLEFVKLVISRLESGGIAYMMTGSMAMAIYAVPRMTRDVDFVIECQPKDAARIAELFHADCYVDEAAVRQAILERSSFNIIHNEWIIKADFIVRKESEYRRVEFGRRQRIDIDGWTLYTVAPEDLILSKLQWSKDSGSELQLRDARSIAEGVADLDWSYMRTWASALGVTDLLERIERHD